MIVETATIAVQPGREDEFVRALEEAKLVLAQAHGWRGITVHRGIERPSVFLLAITWETLEDHTEGFRGGDALRAVACPHRPVLRRAARRWSIGRSCERGAPA